MALVAAAAVVAYLAAALGKTHVVAVAVAVVEVGAEEKA
jgi:hypothetical protein